MRIRVRVDTSKPLCRGRKLRSEDGEIGWIRFKYKRFPIICYWCGRMSHSDKGCELWIMSNGPLTEKDRQFGAWLRAPLFNTRRCSAIRVGGEEEARSGGTNPMVDGEEFEVLGSRSGTGRSSKSDKNCRKKEEARELTMTRKESNINPVTMIVGAELNEGRDSRKEIDFQYTLCEIEAAISKYDNIEMVPKSIGLEFTLGQAEAHNLPNNQGVVGYTSIVEEEMLPTSSPHGNVYKPHGWERLVTERPHAEV